MLCEFSSRAVFFHFHFFFVKCVTLGASSPPSEPPAWEAGNAEEDFQLTFATQGKKKALKPVLWSIKHQAAITKSLIWCASKLAAHSTFHPRGWIRAWMAVFLSLFSPHPQLTTHCDTPALSADSGGRARSYTWSRWIWMYLCVFYAGCEGIVDPVQLCKIHVLRHIVQKINPPTNKFCGKMIFTGDGRTELRITRQKSRATEWVKDIAGPVRWMSLWGEEMTKKESGLSFWTVKKVEWSQIEVHKSPFFGARPSPREILTLCHWAGAVVSE